MVDPKSPGRGVQAAPKGNNKKKSEAELEKTNLRGMVTRGHGVDEMTQLRPQGAGLPEVRSNAAPSPPMFVPPPQAAPAPQPQVAPPTPGPGFVSPAVLPAVAQAVAPAVAQAVAQAVVQAVGNVQQQRPPMPTTGAHRPPASARKPRSVVAWAAPVSLVVSLLALGAVLVVRGDWFQSLVSKDGSRAVRAQEAAATAAPPTTDPQASPAAPTPASTDPTPITATAPMDTMQPATTPHARHNNNWSSGASHPATPAPTHTVVAQQATAPAPTTPAPTAATPAAVPPTAADNDAKNLSSAADKELENLIKQ